MEPKFELHEFVRRLTSMIHKLRETKVLCDVTITTDDGSVEAHSLVLAALSPFLCSTFVRLLGEGSARLQYSIDLTGFSTADVGAALYLLYTGELTAMGSTYEECVDRYQRVIQIYDSLGIDNEMLCTDNNTIRTLAARLVAPLATEYKKNEEPMEDNDDTFIIIESHNLTSTSCNNVISEDQCDRSSTERNLVLSVSKSELAPTSNYSFIMKNGTPRNRGLRKSQILARGSASFESRSHRSARRRFQSTGHLASRQRKKNRCLKLTCSTCAKVFYNRAIFSRHFKANHRDGVKRQPTRRDRQSNDNCPTGDKAGHLSLACESCGKCYRSARCLATHQLAHRGIKPFLCDMCGRGFRAQATLDRHVMLLHTDRRPFVCDRCGKGFVASSRLARHAETHDPASRGRYACETCGADFANAGNLLRHRRLHSARPRPYACDKCGKTFTQKTSLAAHSAIHDPEARRVTAKTCPICGKILSKAANLGRHLQQLHDRDLQAVIYEAASATLRNGDQAALQATDDVFDVGRADTAAAFDDGSTFDETYVLRKTCRVRMSKVSLDTCDSVS